MGAVALLPAAAGASTNLQTWLLHAVCMILACKCWRCVVRTSFYKYDSSACLQDIFEDMAAGRLSSDEYPYVRQPSASAANSFGAHDALCAADLPIVRSPHVPCA